MVAQGESRRLCRAAHHGGSRGRRGGADAGAVFPSGGAARRNAGERLRRVLARLAELQGRAGGPAAAASPEIHPAFAADPLSGGRGTRRADPLPVEQPPRCQPRRGARTNADGRAVRAELPDRCLAGRPLPGPNRHPARGDRALPKRPAARLVAGIAGGRAGRLHRRPLAGPAGGRPGRGPQRGGRADQCRGPAGAVADAGNKR